MGGGDGQLKSGRVIAKERNTNLRLASSSSTKTSFDFCRTRLSKEGFNPTTLSSESSIVAGFTPGGRILWMGEVGVSV